MENESEKELVVAEPIDTEEESVEESDEMEFSDTEESEEDNNQAEDESDNDSEEENEDDESDEEEAQEDETNNGKNKVLSKKERAMYARARRTVEKSVEEKHKKALDKAYERGRLEAYKGKMNPYTNTEIKDLTDVEVYEDMFKIAEEGGDPLKDYASYSADKKREEARIKQEESERQAKAEQDIDDFQKKYPDVNLSDLFKDKNFLDYAEGKDKSLVDVYDSYNKFITSFRNKGIETAKKTIANSISSPGSLSNGSETVVDYATMSKEEFEKVVARVKDGS